MVSIPLPALQVKPAEDPLTGYAKALSIRSAQNENQIQQQQIQGQQIQNQQQQMSLDSQKAIMRAYTETNGDLGKAIPLAAKYGAKPADLATVQSGYIQQQEAALKLSDAKRARALQDADLVKGAHDQISALPPEQRPAAYQQALAGLKSSGVDISQMPPQYPGDEAFQFSGAAIQGHKQLLQEAETIAATQKSNAQAAEANASIPKLQAETAIKQNELQNGPSGPAAEAKYRMVIQKNRAGTATPEELAWGRSYEAANQKTTTSSDTLGIKSVNTSGPSGLAGGKGNGSATSAPAAGGGAGNTGSNLIDEIGQGKMAMSRLDMLLARRPEIAQAVAQKYPDFDSSKVKSYTDAYKSFTSGPDAKQVNAGAVALQHLQQLKQINDDNSIEVHNPMSASYKAYHNLLDTVADELGTFYQEPKTNEVIQSKKDTLGGLLNRDAAISEQVKAMGIKMDEMDQKWQNAAPSKAYQAPMPGMSDKAKAARAALDPEYAQRYQAEQKGANQSQQQAVPVPNAPTATGPNGHKIVVKNGRWVDATTGKPI